MALEILKMGFKPKIFVVEYNSAFGPDKSITIEYADNFNCKKAHSTQLYFGVSITGWNKLFSKYGYKYIAVDENGVNAFFVNPTEFDATFINNIKEVPFKENKSLLKKFKVSSESQFDMISHLKYFNI